MSAETQLTGQIARRLATAPLAELDDALRDTLAWLGDYTASDRTYLTQFYPDGTIAVEHEWLDPSYPPHGDALGVVDGSAFEYSISIARRDERWEVADIAELPPAAQPEQRSFAAFNVTSILQIPVTSNGQIVGVLGLNNQSRRDWKDVDDELLVWICQALGVVIERKWAERELEAAAADAERARDAARHLLGRFNHELRTPLHVILGYTELLQIKASEPDDIDALAQIQFNGRRLLSLIEDLMKLDGEPESGPSLVPLNDVLDEVVDAIAPVIAHRDITVAIEIDDSTELWFDRGRLRQVLYCELAATVQNTPPGTTVTYSTVAETTDRTAVVMAVASDKDEPLSEVAMALAEALLDGESELTVERDSANQWTAVFALRNAPPPHSHAAP